MSSDLLKVLIVDDEYLVRTLLRNCIRWEEIGFDIAGEASCAQEALELVESIKPDIIFTDICMPYMDGIEFSRVVFEKHPEMKIIILTGYEEFEYAKRSIKIGIADFILKPIHGEEIKKAVLAMKEKIEKERSHTEEYAKLKKQLEENLPFLKEKLLNELIQNNSEKEDMVERLSYFHIAIKSDSFQIAVVEVSLLDSQNTAGEEEKLLLKMQCMELVRQYFREDDHVQVFFDNSQRIVILNSDEAIDMTECCEAIKSMIINRVKCFVCIGIGNLHKGERKISASYKEACNALNYKVVAGKNQVISYSDIDFSSSEHFQYQNDQLESLSFCIKAGMMEKAVEILESFYNENLTGYVVTIDAIRVIASNVISTVLNVITELDIRISDIFHHQGQPYDEVFKLDTLPEIKLYLNNLIVSVMNTVERLQTKRVNKAVKEIQEYISENLTNCELSLSSTAKTFFMNPSYLSRIFKQETGQTFVEYLTKTRMEKAIRLLKETDLKAYQISEKVGITDPHYFGICFKKYTGLSINDFKLKK
ncbi:MAG: response regulator [Clostridia bacterium]|nr:response regulator [Clostridia bacterium]